MGCLSRDPFTKENLDAILSALAKEFRKLKMDRLTSLELCRMHVMGDGKDTQAAVDI